MPTNVPALSKCTRCGREHGATKEDIAENCEAVKKVLYSGYVYDGSRTVSHPHIEAIEYISPEDQARLRERNIQESVDVD